MEWLWDRICSDWMKIRCTNYFIFWWEFVNVYLSPVYHGVNLYQFPKYKINRNEIEIRPVNDIDFEFDCKLLCDLQSINFVHTWQLVLFSCHNTHRTFNIMTKVRSYSVWWVAFGFVQNSKNSLDSFIQNSYKTKRADLVKQFYKMHKYYVFITLEFRLQFENLLLFWLFRCHAIAKWRLNAASLLKQLQFSEENWREKKRAACLLCPNEVSIFHSSSHPDINITSIKFSDWILMFYESS